MNDELERLFSAPPRASPSLTIAARLPAHAAAAQRSVAAVSPPKPEAPMVKPLEQPAPRPMELCGDSLVAAFGLRKSYRKGKLEVPVLRDVSVAVRRGEFLAIVGQSGSGKSTLLHLLATLDAPDSGAIFFQGQRIDHLAGARRDALRNRQLGMIFQFYHLLPEFSALENALAPLMITEGAWKYFWHRKAHKKVARDLLRLVGLEHRLKHLPSELSGGEMQRVAIARALINHPQLVLADEPTGNLDQETGDEIMKILRTLNRQQNLTIVMVTHDSAIADQADRIVRLVDGRIEDV